MRMAIQGIGLVGGFGQGIEALHCALQGGRVAPQQMSLERGGVTDNFPLYRASCAGLEEFISKKALRRIDNLSRLTLLAACLALKDAGLLEADHSRMGVVIASGYGALKTTFDFLDSYLDFGYACSSPTHFSNSVHNAAAAHVSMQFKATAPSLSVSQFEMSVPSALLSAQLWLAEGRVDQVLFGAVDEYCEVLRYCRQQFFGEAEQGPIAPHRFASQSAMIGEGASFFLLTRAADQAAYAHIESLRLGNHAVCPLVLPPDDLLLIGADGHAECGRMYAQALQGRESCAYAPLYGSFPAAVGFDLAVAALSLSARRLFDSPQVGAALPGVAAARPLTAKNISCLKFGPGADYGLIRLSR
jgi:3-oxoacyl-[acyl-carrier-protein] synthase II